MEKNPKVFLEHIIESINIIENSIAGFEFDDFSKLQEKQDAVVRRLEIIGEAAKNLPRNFRERHPEISWKEIIGMRDTIVHEYFDVDLNIVWDTVKNDLPYFKKQVKDLLDES